MISNDDKAEEPEAVGHQIQEPDACWAPELWYILVECGCLCSFEDST